MISYKTSDAVLAACALVASFLFWRWGVWGGFNLGFALSYGLFFALVTAFAARKFQRSLKWNHALCGLTALGLAAGFAIFDAAPMFRFVCFAAIVCLTTWYVGGLYQCAKYNEGSARTLFDTLLMLVVYPFRHLAASQKTLFGGREDRRSRVGLVIAGVAAAVPVLLIATLLLSSGDAAFEAVVRRIPSLLGESVPQIMLAAIFFFPLYGLLFCLHNDLERHTGAPRDKTRKSRLEPVLAASFLGALSALYAFYMLTQLAYFFSPFGGLLPEGFTLAQYARRGFFELCVLAAINFLLVMLAAAVVRRREDGKLPKSVFAACQFICGFTLLLIASAQGKMVLYFGELGLTRLRLMVSLFILLLALAFVLLIVRLCRQSFAYMKIMVAASCALLLCMTFADVDRVVMRHNIWAYDTGRIERLDLQAFWQLGEARVPVLVELARSDNEHLRAQALEILAAHWWPEEGMPRPGLARWNLTRQQANTAMASLTEDEAGQLEKFRASWLW